MKPKLSTNWDALVTSAPANAQAAKDAAAKGTSWRPAKVLHNEWDVRSDIAPPPMKPWLKGLDLRGFICGSLLVLGLLDEHRKGNAAWVVRCKCGAYEARTAKALRNPLYIETNPCCRECEYVRKLRAGKSKMLGMPKIDVKTGRPVTLTIEPKEKGPEFVADPQGPGRQQLTLSSVSLGLPTDWVQQENETP